MEEILRGTDEEAIASLYRVIRQDPDFLPAIDGKKFADTPLHVAGGEGRTRLALEILRLAPSFGRKLNPDGLTPIDLALRRGHGRTTASAMLRMTPELARVHGREGITPLHYAAETDDTDLLAHILLTCPKSIDDLNVCGESAVHVAVRNGKRAAFRVLCGWLIRCGRKDVLEWKDGMGNTILDVAASAHQYELQLEIETGVYNEADGATGIFTSTTVAQYLSSKIPFWEKMIILGAYLDFGIRSETRNTLLVVAVLIVSATYQAVLNPPGGVHNGNTDNKGSLKDVFLSNKDSFYNFMLLNSVAFAVSLGLIFLLLPYRRHTFLLHSSMVFLMMSYLGAMKLIWPLNTPARTYTYWGSYLYFWGFALLKTSLASARYGAGRFNYEYEGSDRCYTLSELVKLLYESKHSSAKDSIG